MIVPMGEWVIREALRQLKRFQAIAGRDLKMAVNVSALQIKSPGFPDMLRNAIGKAGVRAGSVEIEITEGLLLEISPEARESLGRIVADGVSIAIDDFGAGHASFQYIRDFPIHKLKIDQMFVRQLVVNSSDALIVQAIATLAKSLELELVAEGIETVEQHQFLREHGCTMGQGYLFSLPLAAEDLAWVLANHTSLPLPARHPSPASPVAMNG